MRRGGRKGRRTGTMVRIARDRIATLFALAEEEATMGRSELADRYVGLARRIGMRYNVRLLAEYREVYCRGCSAYWLEGRTVRTRLRSGRRVRTCLRCGRERRSRLRRPVPRSRELAEAPKSTRALPVEVESGPLDEETDERVEEVGPEDP